MDFTRDIVKHVTYKTIGECYIKGRYSGVELVINTENGYVNATQLMNQETLLGGQAELIAWKHSKEGCKAIEYLAAQLHYIDLIIEVNTAPIGLRGVYVHPRLVPYVAQWNSLVLADKAAVILSGYAMSIAVKGENLALQILEKNNRKLQRKIEKQAERIEELIQLAEVVQGEHDRVAEELVYLGIDLDISAGEIDRLTRRLDVATDQRVPPAQNDGCREVFGIYHYPHSRFYRMIRRQRRSYSAGRDDCIEAGYTAPIFESDSPNAVNLGARLKDILPESLGLVRGNHIVTLPGVTPEDLAGYIVQAEQEKKNI
jgi:KilA-N domain